MTETQWTGCYDDSWKGLIVDEAFAPIPGYEGRYEVSTAGRIRTLIGIGRKRSGEILAGSSNQKGYRRILLSSSDGTHRTSVVHRLVLEAFVGPQPSPRHEVNHKNGIKWDNRVENLEWVTRKENNRHAVVNGLWYPHVGEKHGRAILCEDDVRAIRDLEGVIRQCHLARFYRVNSQTIRGVWTRRIWKHVQ